MTTLHQPTRPAPLNILGIAGSPTGHSRSTALLRSALQALAPRAAALGEIEVRELPAQALLQAAFDHPELVSALQRVARADVVLVATPIYKAAYSGLLKSFLDLLPQDGLRGKIVLPLATGGSAAHLLALDYALKPVLGALGARHILDAVYATDAQFHTDEQQRRQAQPEVQERLLRALAPLLASPAVAAQAPAAVMTC